MEADLIDVSEVRKSFQHFTWTDYSVFVFMLAICTGIGLYFGCVQKQKSTQDYLMGGRHMNVVPVTFSLVASFISGISILGTPTELYIYGTAYIFSLIGACLMSIIISFTFMPVLHDLQVTSAYEYLELRYDKRLRLFGSVIFSMFTMAWLPIVIYVPALAFNQVMSGAMLLVMVKGTMIVGGFDEVMRRNWNTGRIEMPSLSFDLTERHTIWSVSIGSLFYWIGNIAVNQLMMQRYLSLPDLKTSKRAVWWFLGGITLILLTCAYSGMLAFARYFDCDPLDSKLALAKDQILPSLSSGLNSMAAVVLEDFWKPFFRTLSHKETQILIRAVVVVIGCVCVGLVFVVERLGAVLQLTMSLSSASMGPLAGVFLMGIFFPFIDSTSALTGGVIGLSSAWWVAAQAQLAQARGALRFEEKPRFIHNCTYSISYFWYTAFGCIVTIIVACLVNIIPRDKKAKSSNELRLYAPFLRKWIAKKYQIKVSSTDVELNKR
ncbi:hypothetical protein MSG28_010853 [Choristoneura fumiferana]|uniref:Uncharacterized protein n=1 Tax=Choristoneura fumiferana TaxID=7141 RepID=A0ACC0KQ10_CHOFU|nr:hypothetical protein MSG28_010853 [Choristoneura fumiferana]